MKASELTKGLEVVVTKGADSYSRRTNKATKCEVLAEAKAGKVRLKLLEDARNNLGVSGYGSWQKENWRKAGDTITVDTRMVWMTWEAFEARTSNERRVKKEREDSEAASEGRLAELQRRVDQFAGEVDGTVEWGVRPFNRSVAIGDIGREHEETVRMPAEALEALLKAAER